MQLDAASILDIVLARLSPSLLETFSAELHQIWKASRACERRSPLPLNLRLGPQLDFPCSWMYTWMLGFAL
jgi:hypothetical protein